MYGTTLGSRTPFPEEQMKLTLFAVVASSVPSPRAEILKGLPQAFGQEIRHDQ